MNSDDLLLQLDELGKSVEATNARLQAMLDDIQKDWTPEQKLMISNPKEYYKQQNINEEKELMENPEVNEILKQCTVNGFTVLLPPFQMDRKLYQNVAKKLELIGGKWNKGSKGFVFKEDPTKYLGKVAEGESINIKKEFQFFPTPDVIADEMVKMADIQWGQRVLEPSAGQGAIVKAIARACPALDYVYCCELMELNRIMLEKLPKVLMVADDFMDFDEPEFFDRIIANPPFAKRQDIRHIHHMYRMLKPGGIMVTLASPSWSYGTQSADVLFREWLDEVGARWEDIEPGAFKESGTQIGVVRIKIIKEK